jgi:hypothetical protein
VSERLPQPMVSRIWQVDGTLCEGCNQERLDSDFRIGDAGLCRFCKGDTGTPVSPSAALLAKVRRDQGVL